MTILLRRREETWATWSPASFIHPHRNTPPTASQILIKEATELPATGLALLHLQTNCFFPARLINVSWCLRISISNFLQCMDADCRVTASWLVNKGCSCKQSLAILHGSCVHVSLLSNVLRQQQNNYIAAGTSSEAIKCQYEDLLRWLNLLLKVQLRMKQPQ